MIPRAEISSYWTVLSRDPVQVPVESRDVQGIDQRLSAGKVGNVYKGVFQLGINDPFFLKLDGQLIMAVEIELQAERCPGGYPQVAQPQFRVDEVEVVMQTFRLGGFQDGLATGLVVPGLERGALFHGREDVDQTGMVTAPGDDRLDALLLTEVVAPDELDDQPVLLGEFLGMGTYLLSERLGKLWVIEEANAPHSQVSRHGLCMADVGECTSNHHTVKAGQGATNLGCMPIYKSLHAVIIAQFTPTHQEDGDEPLFGSGYAGLGSTGVTYF